MLRTSRWALVASWAVFLVFVLGFFLHAVGVVTGAILGVWFILTQKPLRGFLWQTAVTFLFSLGATWHLFGQTVGVHGASATLTFVGLLALALLRNVLPFTAHRLVSPRLPAWIASLPFPLAAVALPALVLALKIGPAPRVGVGEFFLCWLAAVVIQMWNSEFRAAKILPAAMVFALVSAATGAFALWLHFTGNPFVLRTNQTAGLISLGVLLALAIWSLFRAAKYKTWTDRPEIVSTLQSPFTGSPLRAVRENSCEFLVSTAGERFPVRSGIPTFLKPADLTGDNLKYNHVYETIGGFYDDIQKIFCALNGFDRQGFFRTWMGLLEAKPGDRVLETSVGTGLNFPYLPKGVKLSGLDLSPEMLANCQRNLKRWDLDADLYLGNAESLPFADESFDVVFHVGGINFFNDRAKAIREMIRVAKPGSLILISDETEKHAKEVYEKQPFSPWKNRKAPVSAPVDLIPAEMEEVSLKQLRKGDIYTLTFRKPVAVLANSAVE
jgi:ubiquinone/menaquinone biosynthesis C-methylase UbiE